MSGMINSGFVITGTWPMRTERAVKVASLDANVLASSIVLVSRPRPTDAEVIQRRDFLLALNRELPLALKQLKQGDVPPVDMAQAAIGPGMAIYSRYKQVLEADGTPMPVRTASHSLIKRWMSIWLSKKAIMIVTHAGRYRGLSNMVMRKVLTVLLKHLAKRRISAFKVLLLPGSWKLEVEKCVYYAGIN